MAFVDNLIIDAVVSMSGFDLADNELLFQMNQMQDFTVEGTSESIDVNGMRGQKIATLDRNKGCSISGTNGLFVVNAFATQVGAEIEEASSTSVIEVPFVESVKVTGTTAKLAHTPKDGSTMVYKMARSGGQGEKLTLSADTAATGSYTIADDVITISADETFDSAEKSLIVVYNFDAEEGVKIINDSESFTKEVRLLATIACRDVCDGNIYYTVLEMPRAKIDGNFSLAMGNDAASHPISATTLPNLCSADKTLFNWYVVA